MMSLRLISQSKEEVAANVQARINGATVVVVSKVSKYQSGMGHMFAPKCGMTGRTSKTYTQNQSDRSGQVA